MMQLFHMNASLVRAKTIPPFKKLIGGKSGKPHRPSLSEIKEALDRKSK